MRVAGDRIYVSDLQESFHFVKYHRDSNQLAIFADDTLPRYITAQTVLDYDTIAGADKFGNVFVCRLPADAKDADANAVNVNAFWDTGLLGGAAAVRRPCGWGAVIGSAAWCVPPPACWGHCEALRDF